MRTKKVILLTLLIPVSLILIWYGFKLKPLPEYENKIPYNKENFSVYGEDGTLLPGELKLPEKSNSRSVLLVSDQKLDRNWNSRNMDFQTGKIISHILASNGIPVALYDQRGTGESVMSGRNHPTPENLASDLHVVYERIIKDKIFQGKNLEIIAHGHGCIPALIAINRYSIPVKRIYLLSCVFPGTLLDSWLTQILNNMKRAGVSDSTILEAKNITEAWKKQKEFKPLKNDETNAERNKDQDILSLYSALDYMQKEQMYAWTVQARDVSFLDEINKLKVGVRVYHLLNEYDEEFAGNLVRAWEETTADGKMKKEKNIYTLKIIPKTDHFFMGTTSRSRGVISLILRRTNPFRAMDQTLFNYLLHPEP